VREAWEWGPGHELGGTLQQMRIEFLVMLLYGDIVAQHQESVEDTGQICRSEDRGRLSRAFKAFKGAERSLGVCSNLRGRLWRTDLQVTSPKC
jgi:hypothetical protein